MLTGTNRSIERLIVKLARLQRQAQLRVKTLLRKPESQKPEARTVSFWLLTFWLLIPARPGGYSEGPTPDPIPNSAVKTLSANGTAP